jgi:hypothetical protein
MSWDDPKEKDQPLEATTPPIEAILRDEIPELLKTASDEPLDTTTPPMDENYAVDET